MKRFLSLLIIVAITFGMSVDIHAEGISKIFYNGRTHNLTKGVFTFGNEYFFDAAEISRILALKLEVDKPGKKVSVLVKTQRKEYPIVTGDDLADLPENFQHNTPEMIDGRLLFPFTFIRNALNLTIKYNKDSGMVYALNSDPSGKLVLKSFSNLSYGYSLTFPEGFYLNDPSASTDFDDSFLTFSDPSSSLSLGITSERLDNAALQEMREYLNDYTSSDQIVFDKFIEYRKSFFNALQNYYSKSFQYGSEDPNYSESNLKIFGEYNDEYSGKEVFSVLYNTIVSNINETIEQTHLDIIIPVHKSMSLYSLHFSMERGSLDAVMLKKIESIVTSLRIQRLPYFHSRFSFLLDRKGISDANNGIYPEPGNSELSYTTYENSRAGYRLTYPSSYLPYINNNIIDSYNYASFKINYNHYFSVHAEPVSGKNPVSNKLQILEDLYGKGMEITEQGSASFDDFEAQFIKYEITAPQGTTFVQDYFITKGPMLYTIELNSKFARPSSALLQEFLKIVGSLKFKERNYSLLSDNSAFTRYENLEEGYTFKYPSNWLLTEAADSSINYEALTLVNPSISGPVNITIQEGELSSYLLYSEPASFLKSKTSDELKQYFKKYDAPYLDMPSNILAGNYSIKGDTLYFTRLVNYQDELGRSKYCYSVDTIRGLKSTSMFISVSDYAEINRDLYGDDLFAAINTIGNSFSHETTKEYLQRRLQGETRNRRIVFIEEHFKRAFGASASIQWASDLESGDDILIALDGVPEKGYYRVKPDYTGNDLQIVERLLKSEVLNEASQELKDMYGKTEIKEITVNEESMTLNVSFSNNSFSPVINAAYSIVPELQNGKLDWKLEKNYDYDLLKSNCINFIEEGLSPSLKAYFPSQSELEQAGSTQDRKYYYVPVYTESDTSAGYFVLGINSLDDSIDIISYTPIEAVYEQIRSDLSLLDSDFILARSFQSEKSRFEVKTIWISAQMKEFKIRTLKVQVNQDTLDLEIK